MTESRSNPSASCADLPTFNSQAIQAALDKKATIISMAWTIPKEDDNQGTKQREFFLSPLNSDWSGVSDA